MTSTVSAGISCGFSWGEFFDEVVEPGDVTCKREPLQGRQRLLALPVLGEREEFPLRLVTRGDEPGKMDLAPARVRAHCAHVQQRQWSPEILGPLGAQSRRWIVKAVVEGAWVQDLGQVGQHGPEPGGTCHHARQVAELPADPLELGINTLRRAAWENHDGELPVVEGTLIRLAVDHLPGQRDAEPVWLWSSRAGTAEEEVNRAWHCLLYTSDAADDL